MSYASGSRLVSVSPAATTNTPVFTATLETEITRMLVANRNAGAAAIRVYHVRAGETLADSDALYYDVSVAANSFLDFATQAPGGGIHLEIGDTLHVRASTTGVNFNIYGVSTSIAPGTGG